MEHELILFLIESRIKKELRNIEKNVLVPRTPRNGRDFVFEDHEDKIFKEIRTTIDELAPSLKLKLSDLSESEISGLKGKDFSFEENENQINSLIKKFVLSIKSDLKLKFSDLSEDEISGLKGTDGKDGIDGKNGLDGENGKDGRDGLNGRDGRHGNDGKDGKDFLFEENKEEISDLIKKYFDKIKSDLKITLSDLTDEEIKLIRGPRGYRGQKGDKGSDGKDFSLEESSQFISSEILKIFNNQKDSLKFKFSDFTENEISGLKGKDGRDGRPGKSAFDLWVTQGNLGALEDFLKSLKGDIGPRGAPGLIGLNGLDGKNGLNGRDGQDAPYITEVSVNSLKKNKISFTFYFSNGFSIETNEIELPISKDVYNSIVYAFSSASQNDDSTDAIFYNLCEIESNGTLLIEDDGGVNIKNSLSKSQVIRNNVTVSNLGELTIESSSGLDLKDN